MKNDILKETMENTNFNNDLLSDITSKSKNLILSDITSAIPISNNEKIKTSFVQSNSDILDKKTVKPQFQKSTIGKANGRRGHGRGCV